MNHKSSLYALLLLGVLAITAACSRTPDPASGVQDAVAALRANDLQALIHTTLPPAQIEEMRASWAEQATKPIDPVQSSQFREQMARLTAGDGVDQLMVEVEPQLAQLKPMLPMWLGMGRGFAQSTIEQDEKLDDARKAELKQAAAAFFDWADSTDLSDPARARQALTALSDGARSLELTTLEQVHALSFDDALERGGAVLEALKGMLSAYGMDVDAMLASVKSTTVEKSADRATVETRYTMLGRELSVRNEMQLVDGRWYSVEAVTPAGADSGS